MSTPLKCATCHQFGDSCHKANFTIALRHQYAERKVERYGLPRHSAPGLARSARPNEALDRPFFIGRSRCHYFFFLGLMEERLAAQLCGPAAKQRRGMGGQTRSAAVAARYSSHFAAYRLRRLFGVQTSSLCALLPLRQPDPPPVDLGVDRVPLQSWLVQHGCRVMRRCHARR